MCFSLHWLFCLETKTCNVYETSTKKNVAFKVQVLYLFVFRLLAYLVQPRGLEHVTGNACLFFCSRMSWTKARTTTTQLWYFNEQSFLTVHFSVSPRKYSELQSCWKPVRQTENIAACGWGLPWLVTHQTQSSPPAILVSQVLDKTPVCFQSQEAATSSLSPWDWGLIGCLLVSHRLFHVCIVHASFIAPVLQIIMQCFSLFLWFPTR